jgi:hypothetical protein
VITGSNLVALGVIITSTTYLGFALRIVKRQELIFKISNPLQFSRSRPLYVIPLSALFPFS